MLPPSVTSCKTVIMLWIFYKKRQRKQQQHRTDLPQLQSSAHVIQGTRYGHCTEYQSPTSSIYHLALQHGTAEGVVAMTKNVSQSHSPGNNNRQVPISNLRLFSYPSAKERLSSLTQKSFIALVSCVPPCLNPLRTEVTKICITNLWLYRHLSNKSKQPPPPECEIRFLK